MNKLNVQDMKRTIIKSIMLMLVATLFIACDDPYADQFVAEPTVNEQLPLHPAEGFSFAMGSQFASPIVLTKEDIESGKRIEVIKASATPTLPEGTSLKYKIEVSDTKSFDKLIIIPSVSDGNAASISAEDLNEVVKTLYGKAPFEREIYFRATSFLVDNNATLQIDTKPILGPASITPVGQVIESAYYLIGDINGWDIENLDDLKFNHSGKDVYEDPYFSILVKDVEGYFKIVPQSSKEAASWDGVLGNPIDGNTDLEGELVIDDSQAMRVTEPGWVKINLNMLEFTYTIEIIGEMNLELFIPGGYQGWSPETAPTVYSRNLDFKYEGYVYFGEASEYKFASQPNWDGPNYGSSDEEGILSDDGGAGNLNITEPGYYKLNVDLSGAPYTYSATKTDWGIIGDATPNGWDGSTAMTYDADTKLWSVVAELSDKEFKFRANDSWDINIGGDMDNLTYDGDNIKVAEAGTYLIVLDLSDPTIYKASITKQ